MGNKVGHLGTKGRINFRFGAAGGSRGRETIGQKNLNIPTEREEMARRAQYLSQQQQPLPN